MLNVCMQYSNNGITNNYEWLHINYFPISCKIISCQPVNVKIDKRSVQDKGVDNCSVGISSCLVGVAKTMPSLRWA